MRPTQSTNVADMLDIVIVYFHGRWRVLTSQGFKGQFDFRVDAEEAALRLAGRSPGARIHVQSRYGELEPLAA